MEPGKQQLSPQNRNKRAGVMWRYFFLVVKLIKINYMKTAAFYIKNKYDFYKEYSEELIREVCHIWCEVIEEAQNDVKKEYEEKNRWIPVEEKLPPLNEQVLLLYDTDEYCVGVMTNYGFYLQPFDPIEQDFGSIYLA